MYIKIGKYSDYISSYSYTKHIEKYIGEDGCDRLDSFIQPILNFIWNDRFWNQRKVKIKIHRYDTWSMDHTLAMIIVPMLKQLKETKQGAPLVDDEDVPDELKSTNALPGKDSDVDSNHFKRWDWILDEMIWAYKQDAMDDDWEEQYYTEKVDREVIDKHYKRMQNGHRLFGKYYNALWS